MANVLSERQEAFLTLLMSEQNCPIPPFSDWYTALSKAVANGPDKEQT